MVETVVTVERTTTQTAAPGTTGTGGLKINIGYFQTVPGILKLVQFVLGIFCLALASPAHIPATGFFLFVAVVAFIGTILWIFAYLLSIRESLNLAVKWVLTELINTGIIALLYFIAFIVQLAGWSSLHGYGKGSNITAGVFGLFNFLAYAAGTYFLYVHQRSGATY